MSIRALVAAVIGIAMLFAPLALQGGAAMAMTPAPTAHSEVMSGGHCADHPPKEKKSTSENKSCCAAMCTAIVTSTAMAVEPHHFASLPDRPVAGLFRHSFLAELPTPPPRVA